MKIAKEFTFDSAHFLTDYHGKCEKLHGHTYRMRVVIEGEVQANGLVMDFAELKEIVNKKVVNVWDHANINDTLEHPSAENMCIWAWNQLKDDLKGLFEIRIWETANSFAIYNGQ
ncbi:6-carboxytetrahydropterin synthase QueD [Candidatus Peregrinibacteria bacterium]|nr:6-carboxytetrahydropterin synthase QueD [Candidatus Peregrinibacteria bacterium]